MSSEVPQIKIDGKTYKMPKPKIKLWRHMVKFTEDQANGDLEGEAMLDGMIELVTIAFNNPDVTKEAVEENVDFEELAEIFKYIQVHVTKLVNVKQAQVPNGKAPTGAN